MVASDPASTPRPTPALAPFRPVPFIERDIQLDRRADGTLRLRNAVPLGPGAPHVPALLASAAQRVPDRTWLARRAGEQRQWRTLDYGGGKRAVDAVTQALLDLNTPGRTVAVLSGNGIEHAVLQLAAMQARMPVVAITPAYALLAEDLGKLQSMLDLIAPAVVFVESARMFARALRGLRLDGATVVCVDDPLPDVPAVRWQQWLARTLGPAVAASVAAITPQTVAKYLFTSGSTGMPKAVAITQSMLTVAVAMHQQLVRADAVEAPSLRLDWLPWSHVAGGNIGFCKLLAEAGTMYIDDGKPAPGAFDETLRNLREISPTEFSSVPIGFTMLADALEADDALGAVFFRNLHRLGYAGARMPDAIFDRIQAQAVKHCGHRIVFGSGYGSTETAAAVTATFWPTDWAGCIGLPHPGVELALLPLDHERYELRVHSPVVTPGYLDQPQATAESFDDEGFFKIGDAVQFVDAQRPIEGLVFAGRVAEEFKLQSGVFVRVGTLRVEALQSSGGLLADVVVAGADQRYVALLAWPNLAACRARVQAPAAGLAEFASAPWLRAELLRAFQDHNRRLPGSSQQVRRVLLLAEPPSMAAGEITDKGYVNQRMVLARRAADAARLYADPPDGAVIVID